jgi:hypothetical protein
MHFLWAGVQGEQMHQCMCALSCGAVHEWTEMCKNGHTSVSDAERLGRPTTATTAQNEQRARN